LHLFELFKNYFLGELLREYDRDTAGNRLKQANALMLFYVVAFVIAFLLILQVTYLFTGNTMQFIKGWFVLGLFSSCLFYLKWRKSIDEVAHLMVTLSLLNVILNFYLFAAITFFNGLITVVNLLFAYHILGRRAGLMYGILHLIPAIFFMTVFELSILPAAEPVKQTFIEKIMLLSLLTAFILFMLSYYNKAYELAGIELTKAIRDLRKSKETAETMNRLKSNFLSSMSHEIRTPLNGILGINQVLKKEIDSHDLQELIEIQYESGERLLRTIDSILRISKLETEQAFFAPINSNINSVLSETCRSLKMLAHNKGVELREDLHSGELYCFVDETMLMQVINNLIGNAIKFTHQGTITVKSEKKVEQAVIAISDTGIGISTEFVDQLFQPFTQESKEETSPYGGNGLGLSITRKYVEMMGGNIEVSSEKNSGSQFRVYLPLTNSTER